MDITKYRPIIRQVLSEVRVPRNQREDMEQECYVALLENKEDLDHPDDRARASVICRSRIANVRRKEGQFRAEYRDNPKINFESLSDPRVMRQAMEISQPGKTDIQDDQIWAAIAATPDGVREVLGSLYVAGATLRRTAETLGMTIEAVRWKRDKGISLLKKYFEEE